MSDAVAAIRVLLVGAAAVTAISPADRIMAGTIKQGTELPALSIVHISTVPIGAIDAQAEYSLVTSRVQVTGMAKDYPGVKTLLRAVRKACNYESGILAGIEVTSIVRDTVGPDQENPDAGICMQTMDFKVTFHEQN